MTAVLLDVCVYVCVCVRNASLHYTRTEEIERKLYILALLFRKLLMLLLPYLGESYCVDKAFQDPVYVC